MQRARALRERRYGWLRLTVAPDQTIRRWTAKKRTRTATSPSQSRRKVQDWAGNRIKTYSVAALLFVVDDIPEIRRTREGIIGYKTYKEWAEAKK